MPKKNPRAPPRTDPNATPVTPRYAFARCPTCLGGPWCALCKICDGTGRLTDEDLEIMTFTLYTTYSKALAKPNTAFYVPAIETFRARLKVGGGPEVSPVDIHVRFRGKAKAPGVVHCHMIDGSTALLESARLHDDLPYRLELVITEIPEPIAMMLLAL